VKLFKVAVILLVATSACRTPGTSSVKDDGVGGASLYCSFVGPLATGETFEIWATTGDGSQLTNVSERYSSGAGDTGPTADVGSAPAVPMTAITAGGSIKFRAYFKNIVNINGAQNTCYNVDPNNASGHTGYLCLGHVDPSGSVFAYWATQAARQRYATDLTVYSTTCGAPQS
jgi:hypothetical protein